jgi:hypothetical protein
MLGFGVCKPRHSYDRLTLLHSCLTNLLDIDVVTLVITAGMLFFGFWPFVLGAIVAPAR